MILGGNPSIGLYLFGTFMATIIDKLGTDAQKERYVRRMLDEHWGGTMVLTEPDAGSDVGAGRTKATPLLLDLRVFLFGGGGAPVLDLLRRPALEELERRAFGRAAADFRLEAASLGNDAGILGAAAVAG